MKRRAFITGLGGVAAWPLTAPAQETIRHVAVIVITGESNPRGQGRLNAFLQDFQGTRENRHPVPSHFGVLFPLVQGTTRGVCR
jgi:hypothetical protein